MEYVDFPSKTKRNEYTVEWCSESIEQDPMSLYYLRGDKTEISTNKDVKSILTKFVYVSSIGINRLTAEKIFFRARMRWMIEDQGFSYQKNSGLNLHH